VNERQDKDVPDGRGKLSADGAHGGRSVASREGEFGP